MKRFFCALMACGAMFLAGCEASASPSDAKGTLEKNGYTVEAMKETEAKARIEGINFNVTVNDVVIGAKARTSVFVGFYCVNIDDASKFIHENIQALYNFGKSYNEDAVCGSKNNLAYVATLDAAQLLGLK